MAKLGTVAEEADETEHWLAVVRGCGVVRNEASLSELDWLTTEASELRAIFVQSVATARLNLANLKAKSSNRS